MLIFRLIFGLLLVSSLVCLVLGVVTGNPVWKRRGMKLVKWAVFAAVGFFGVLSIERIHLLLK